MFAHGDTPVGLTKCVRMCEHTTMKFASENTAAAKAIEDLRVRTLLREVPKTQLAQATGTTRATVAKYLKAGDMSLGLFLDIAQAIGADPAEIIKEATAA